MGTASQGFDLGTFHIKKLTAFVQSTIPCSGHSQPRSICKWMGHGFGHQPPSYTVFSNSPFEGGITGNWLLITWNKDASPSHTLSLTHKHWKKHSALCKNQQNLPASQFLVIIVSLWWLGDFVYCAKPKMHEAHTLMHKRKLRRVEQMRRQ